MSKLFLALLLSGLSLTCLAQTEKEMKSAALKGDYQAQRNLAYSYGTGWGTVGGATYVAKKPIESCAWYRTILLLDSNKIKDADYSNEWVYCHTLSLSDASQAWERARTYKRQILSRK
ncbi:hypothetical protein [uncultured Deefgea sp.]|uniref:hypothetical protein n=1 Tax=uncultured Deefgea sp. TaxID=1304914 RepID=UPI0026245307|nr:hypothetical protein [uncultured Deefgea sp.]